MHSTMQPVAHPATQLVARPTHAELDAPYKAHAPWNTLQPAEAKIAHSVGKCYRHHRNNTHPPRNTWYSTSLCSQTTHKIAEATTPYPTTPKSPLVYLKAQQKAKTKFYEPSKNRRNRQLPKPSVEEIDGRTNPRPIRPTENNRFRRLTHHGVSRLRFSNLLRAR